MMAPRGRVFLLLVAAEPLSALLLPTADLARGQDGLAIEPISRHNAQPTYLSDSLLAVSACSRRTMLAALLLPLTVPVSARAEGTMGVTSSARLTVAEYLRDIRTARRGLDELQPLLELGEERGNEAVRIALRKPPASGIRKACSKILVEIEGTPMAAAKQQSYANVKASLASLDDGCRPGLKKSSGELVAELGKLEAALDAFIDGLGM